MIVKYSFPPDTPLTGEEIEIIEAAKKRPFVYDKDCPPMTDEQLRQFRRVIPSEGRVPRPLAAGE